MGFIDKLVEKLKGNALKDEDGILCECCPRCEANLILQKGYDNRMPVWRCRGCGEMLINPDIQLNSNIVWICDKCAAVLNLQDDFEANDGKWECKECGFSNQINPGVVYASEDAFQSDVCNPYKGLNDEELLKLMIYEDGASLGGRENVIQVRNLHTGELFVKKVLYTYDRSIYDYLKDHPVKHMPHIIEVFEGSNALIVIEEFVQGKTIHECIESGPIPEMDAVRIVRRLCGILKDLHGLERPIVHRDVKPSNIMITPEGEVLLLDVNASKWHKPEEIDDTRHIGTMYYAAPEQAGFGMHASTPKADVYSIGVLLNVMTVGKFPKEEKASDRIWKIVKQCIYMEPEERCTLGELIGMLEETEGMGHV